MDGDEGTFVGEAAVRTADDHRAVGRQRRAGFRLARYGGAQLLLGVMPPPFRILDARTARAEFGYLLAA